MSNALDRCRVEWNDRCERRGKEYAMVRHDDLAKLIEGIDAALKIPRGLYRDDRLDKALDALTQESP